jgi:hypothetical protein
LRMRWIEREREDDGQIEDTNAHDSGSFTCLGYRD